MDKYKELDYKDLLLGLAFGVACGLAVIFGGEVADFATYLGIL